MNDEIRYFSGFMGGDSSLDSAIGRVKRLSVFAVLWAAVTLVSPGSVLAGEVTVAVAANFSAAAQKISAAFEAETGDEVTLVIGSTGKLAAQISLGAPFHVLLAADQQRPKWLVDNGNAEAGSQFTYATGRLVLVGLADGESADAATVLRGGMFRRLAIANPKFAPYGAAALETFKNLGVSEQMSGKLIYGENVQQAYAYAASGNSEWAMVAAAQLKGGEELGLKHILPIASKLHSPIRQDAVLLRYGKNNSAAKAFLAFMKTTTTQLIVSALGYDVSDRPAQ